MRTQTLNRLARLERAAPTPERLAWPTLRQWQATRGLPDADLVQRLPAWGAAVLARRQAAAASERLAGLA